MLRLLELRAAAKINLTLAVFDRREDGRHALETVMQSVSLYDRIGLERLPEEGKIELAGDAVTETPETNTAFRAAKLFLHAASAPGGVRITLTKAIPMAAGLGGGSADAAAVLNGLNLLFASGFSDRKREELGMRIGADVPFCIRGGTQLARGAGEELSPFCAMPSCFFVLAKKGNKTSTADMYRLYDEKGSAVRPDLARLEAAFRHADPALASAELKNAFTGLTNGREYACICQSMKRYGALACSLSGSGPAVFGVFQEKAAAERCQKELAGLSAEAFLCEPCPSGCEILSKRE